MLFVQRLIRPADLITALLSQNIEGGNFLLTQLNPTEDQWMSLLVVVTGGRQHL